MNFLLISRGKTLHQTQQAQQERDTNHDKEVVVSSSISTVRTKLRRVPKWRSGIKNVHTILKVLYLAGDLTWIHIQMLGTH